MSVPATMTRPPMTRFGAVDGVLLGHGTTAAPARLERGREVALLGR